MTDLLTENARLRAALEAVVQFHNSTFTGPCAAQNKGRTWKGTLRKCLNALATPAPDAVQEAAMVPEIAALIEAARNLVCHDGWGTVNYTDNGMWLDAETLRAAFIAIAGDRT